MVFERLIYLLRSAIIDTEFENKVYLVGGCVRDYVLDIPPNDIDIVVKMKDGARPLVNLLKRKFNLHGPIDAFPFGMIKLHFPVEDQMFELDIMPMLSEIKDESYGCMVDLTYSSDIQQDASRRDFTINTLYFDLTQNKIVDPLNGLDDLNNQKIVQAKDSFVLMFEDPIRLLRAIRLKHKLSQHTGKNWEIENLDVLDHYSKHLSNSDRFPNGKRLILREFEKASELDKSNQISFLGLISYCTGMKKVVLPEFYSQNAYTYNLHDAWFNGEGVQMKSKFNSGDELFLFFIRVNSFNNDYTYNNVINYLKSFDIDSRFLYHVKAAFDLNNCFDHTVVFKDGVWTDDFDTDNLKYRRENIRSLYSDRIPNFFEKWDDIDVNQTFRCFLINQLYGTPHPDKVITKQDILDIL